MPGSRNSIFYIWIGKGWAFRQKNNYEMDKNRFDLFSIRSWFGIFL